MYLPDAIDGFITELETSGLAGATVSAQRQFIERFRTTTADVARKRGKRSPLQLREIDPGVIAAYFADCTGEQGNRNNMTIVLRKFLRWCEMGRELPGGTADRLLATRRCKKPVRRPKHYVPAEQFPVLISSAERHPADRATIALALFTLGRSSEVASIRMKHVDLAEATMSVWRQKRHRWTDVGICPELLYELGRWLGWMAWDLGYNTAHHMTERQPEWRVIPRLVPRYQRDWHGRLTSDVTYEMDPLSPQMHLERVVKRGLDATGAITDAGKTVRHVGEGMHTIRRSGARAMLDHLSEGLGFDRALIQVSTMLDHEDTKQTLLYIGMDQEREKLNDWLRGNSLYGSGESSIRPDHGQAPLAQWGNTSVRHLRAV